MEKTKPHEREEDPGIAVAEHGEVFLDGPDGVAVTMTPEAAAETAASLTAAAESARRQQHDEAVDTSED